MHLDQIAAYLATQGCGTVGTSLFIGFFPPSPDSAICIYDAGGTPAPLGAAVPWAEHRIEIRVRAENYAAAMSLAFKALAALDHKAGVVMGTSTSEYAKPDAPPFLLMRDDQRRVIVMLRATVALKRNALY